MSNRRSWDLWLGAGCGIVALIAYLATIHAFAHPGDPARQLVQHLGLEPRQVPSHPLWSLAVTFVAAVPVGTIGLRVALLSAACGALTTWLLYETVAGAVLGVVEKNPSNVSRAVIASRLAGLSAVLFLSFSIPFWTVSNRAHVAAFEVLLLVLCARLLLAYALHAQSRHAFALAFVCGIGIVESTILIAFALAFGISLLFAMWRHNSLRFVTLFWTIVAGMLGLSLYLLSAWWYRHSDGYQLYGYSGFWQVIRFTWREQYNLLVRNLPKTGWLLVGLTTVVPSVVSLVVAGRALNDERDWTYYILHSAMSLVALGVLFNARFAPWPLFGFSRLLVTPYVLAAGLYGYLGAYWYLLFSGSLSEKESSERTRFAGATLAWAGTCIWLGMAAFAAVRNGTHAHHKEVDELGRHARAIVEGLGSQTWLATHGIFDENILLAAYDLRRKLVTLDLNKGRSPVYLKYVEKMFSEPRLRNLARVGIIPLVQGWIKCDKDAAAKLALLIMPDLWSAAGFQAIPNYTVFLGAKQDDSLDPSALLAEHQKFWKLLRLSSPSKDGPQDTLLRAFAAEAHRQLSMVANNLGVLLEDLGDENGAVVAYSKARELNPANMSVLYNLSFLFEKKGEKELLENVRKDLAMLGQRKTKWGDAWSLAQYDGYVRHYDAFVQIGNTWDVSGQPALAVAAFRRALMLSPEESKPAIQLRLASCLLRSNNPAEAETVYLAVLEKKPGTTEALFGLARISIMKGDFERAHELLNQADTLGASLPELSVERAYLEELEGNLKEARALLEKALQANPEHHGALSALGSLLARSDDEPAFESVLEKVQALEQGTDMALFLRASRAFHKKDLVGCRKLLEEALRRAKTPDPRMFEMFAKIDYMEGRYELAEQHALKLLQLNPDNPAGNYIRGHLQARRGELELAEDSLRHSLETAETPEALNDLAWVLQEKGQYQEAEENVRRALRVDDKRYQAWDTLGVVLMKLERLAEAEQAFDRSLELSPGDPVILLHLADLRVRQNDRLRALEILKNLGEREAILSEENRQKLAELKRKAERL